MVDVIDFKDLSTHLVEKRDPSISALPSAEQLAKEKKSMSQLYIFGGLFILVALIAYMFLYKDRYANGKEAGAYQVVTDRTFSSIRQEYINLREITCNEGERQDCISYTLSFYPQAGSDVSQGLAISDINRLGEYFNVILQSKLKQLTSRKGDLTFTIISTNLGPEGESKVTYTCAEYYGQIQCSQ